MRGVDGQFRAVDADTSVSLRQNIDRASGSAADIDDSALSFAQDALDERNDDRAASAKPPVPLLQARMDVEDLVFHRLTVRSIFDGPGSPYAALAGASSVAHTVFTAGRSRMRASQAVTFGAAEALSMSG